MQLPNISTANEVVIETIVPRHLPNGADPLTTAGPITTLSPNTLNATGIRD